MRPKRLVMRPNRSVMCTKRSMMRLERSVMSLRVVSHVSKAFNHASGAFSQRSVKGCCLINDMFTIQFFSMNLLHFPPPPKVILCLEMHILQNNKTSCISILKFPSWKECFSYLASPFSKFQGLPQPIHLIIACNKSNAYQVINYVVTASQRKEVPRLGHCRA